MVINTFTYYKHFEEINEFLMYAYFIDGETYQIEVLSNNKIVIYGNFIINYKNYIVSGHEGQIVYEGFSVDEVDLKKILKLVRPLKFKQIQ